MLNKLSAYWELRKQKKHLRELRKMTAYRLACDADLLSEEQCSTLHGILARIRGINRKDLSAVTACVEEEFPRVDAMNPYKGYARTIRNFLDVLAVAFGVAFGVRGLFLQPFKIPTGSMQPTLFGIHYVDRAGLEKHGGFLAKKLIPLTSRRAYLKVERAGELSHDFYPFRSWLINESAEIKIGGVPYTLPGNFYSNILRYADFSKSWYEAGDVLCDGWLVTGDHLFVERVSIHFRGIHRGDVAVFTTENIHSPTQPMGGFYYVKRIVGLPGDTIRIDGKILKIRPKGETQFRPASEFASGFRKSDSFMGGYQGHIADGILADHAEVTVPENHFFALGDNTSNSLDGRNWGFIPRRNIIGLGLNVFWPITRRWGIVDTKEPIPEPTALPESMAIQ